MLDALEIAAWVEQALDDSDYDQGIVEDIKHRATNNSKSIAQLVGILYAKELLTEKEVSLIVNETLPAEYNEQ